MEVYWAEDGVLMKRKRPSPVVILSILKLTIGPHLSLHCQWFWPSLSFFSLPCYCQWKYCRIQPCATSLMSGTTISFVIQSHLEYETAEVWNVWKSITAIVWTCYCLVKWRQGYVGGYLRQSLYAMRIHEWSRWRTFRSRRQSNMVPYVGIGPWFKAAERKFFSEGTIVIFFHSIYL